MAEITAIVSQENLFTTSTNLANPAVLESISQIGDVDTSTLANGSVLVYKSNTNKWVSTTLLDQQHVEAGEF
jgi:hypothetical protein